MKSQDQFAKALKAVRKAKGLTQEDFSEGSSRTYVSSLERGLKSPTLSKVNELSEILGVRPLTLLLLAYAPTKGSKGLQELLKAVEVEALAIIEADKNQQG